MVKPVRFGRATSFSAPGKWSPNPGTVEWYQKEDYLRPGVLSPLHSVIAGHVSYNGEPDVFADLEDVKIGDTVIVTYASGAKYTFTVKQIIVETKTKIQNDQRVWGYHKPARSVALFTCDDEFGTCEGGHLCGNRAIIAA